ncbi:hypothetical protein DXG01_006421 [Tephrocybe rancida]|nr:hypothetical protein DXG01_006421 [Tephrocybe rancida]
MLQYDGSLTPPSPVGSYFSSSISSPGCSDTYSCFSTGWGASDLDLTSLYGFGQEDIASQVTSPASLALWAPDRPVSSHESQYISVDIDRKSYVVVSEYYTQSPILEPSSSGACSDAEITRPAVGLSTPGLMEDEVHAVNDKKFLSLPLFWKHPRKATWDDAEYLPSVRSRQKQARRISKRQAGKLKQATTGTFLSDVSEDGAFCLSPLSLKDTASAHNVNFLDSNTAAQHVQGPISLSDNAMEIATIHSLQSDYLKSASLLSPSTNWVNGSSPSPESSFSKRLRSRGTGRGLTEESVSEHHCQVGSSSQPSPARPLRAVIRRKKQRCRARQIYWPREKRLSRSRPSSAHINRASPRARASENSADIWKPYIVRDLESGALDAVLCAQGRIHSKDIAKNTR